MTQHIGIVACSAPGAALCYQTICAEVPAELGVHEHPEISLHAYSFAEHVRRMEASDWPGVGRLMAGSAAKLAAIGAAFAICPDNTAHQGMDVAQAESPIPWLHIAEVVAAEAVRSGAKRLGVLGTRYLMEGPVYADKLAAVDLDWCIPGPADRDTVDGIIFGDLVFGRVTPEARAELGRIIHELQARESCDSIVLGCTELPLAISDELTDLPLLDSTRLLARAALRRSIEGTA